MSPQAQNLVDSPISSSPGHTPFPYRRRSFNIKTPFRDNNRKNLFQEGTAAIPLFLSAEFNIPAFLSAPREIFESSSSEELEEQELGHLASPARRNFNDDRISHQSPFQPRTPQSGKKSPGLSLSRQTEDYGDCLHREVIDADAFTKTRYGTALCLMLTFRESLSVLRSKADEYKTLLEEKKKALETSRMRDRLIQRVRSEEARKHISSSLLIFQ